jgi:Plasmid maintenance system antidote protein
MENNISEYIVNKLKEENLTQADLARGTGMTTGGVSMLINETRKPSPESLLTLAKFFREKPEKLYRIAGYLPEPTEGSPTLEEINYKISLLPIEKQQIILDLVDSMIDKNIRQINGQSAEQKP